MPQKTGREGGQEGGRGGGGGAGSTGRQRWVAGGTELPGGPAVVLRQQSQQSMAGGTEPSGALYMSCSSTHRRASRMGATERRRAGTALLLALLGTALVPSGRCAVTPYDLPYSDDSFHLFQWSSSFINFPDSFWSRQNNRPCGEQGYLPYQGCTCGIIKDGSSYVTKVDLSYSSLPPGTPRLRTTKKGLNYIITGLLYLESLDLSGNLVQGPLIPQLALFPSLRSLVLSNNRLSGSIPQQLCNIQALSCLDLSNNSFSGPIPSCWRRFPCVDFANSGLNFTAGVDCDSSTTRSSCAPLDSILAPPPPPARQTGLSGGAIAGIVVGTLAVAALLAAGGVLLARLVEKRRKEEERRRLSEDIETQISTRHFGTLRRFSVEELARAANGFDDDNLLGEGGFSKVYKGRLEDGTPVAIKRIKDERKGGELEFLNEVELISRAVHRNLMHCEGFCVEAGECMLVLPFYSNGSVASRTNGKQGDPLSWPKRQHIARGAAEGIAYLHTDCSPKVIHRDIKADNVLLDENDEPIIADFGLAKEVDVKESHRTTAVKGTIGFIAPEYFVSGQCSEKTDVYAFGVFLLELLSGKDIMGLSAHLEASDTLLKDWVASVVKGNRLEELLDPELLGGDQGTDLQEVLKELQVALLCMQPDPNDRPTMEQVAKMLMGKGLAERWQQWQVDAGQVSKEEVMAVVNTPMLWESTTTGISLDAFGIPAPR